MKKLVLGLIALFFSCIAVFAVPAYPGLITTTQPDETVISFYLRGDENFSFTMTEDGYLIALNDDGVFEYAQLTDEQTIVPLGVKASDISKRNWKEKNFIKKVDKVSDIQSALKSIADDRIEQKRQRDMHRAPAKYPTQGSPKSLVILVNFKDLKFVRESANADFNSMLNDDNYTANGATSSAREYFYESSFGQFNPNFVVLGPYDLPEDVKYYGGNKSTGGTDLRPDSMIVQACRLADQAGVDFTEFDTDSNKILDNVFVYYAGHNEAEWASEDHIWPHRGNVRGKVYFDGVQVKGYACTSELKGNRGDVQCGIGTFCHEFGHVLELPDLYVTDYSHTEPTLRSWDIMDNGSYNNEGRTPPTYSAYERFFCGWLTPEPIDAVLGLHHLEPLVTSNKAYIFSKTSHNLDGYSPNPNEFFMLENRQRIGVDSLGVPGEGLLVTRIKYDYMYWMLGINNPNKDPNNMRVKIQCAAGTTEKDNERNTFPGADDVASFYFEMFDGSKWETPVTSIREHGRDISFIYGSDENTPSVEFLTPISEFSAFQYESVAQTVEFVCRNIEGELKVAFKKFDRHYQLRTINEDGSDGEFESEIIFNIPSKEEFRGKFQIVFTPRIISPDELLSAVVRLENADYVTELEVSGKSRKPIDIVTPVAYPATDITKNSFVANWSYDEYATAYYLSVYTKEETESNEVEKFATFGNGAPLGWNANFTTTNKTYTASAPLSLQFKTNADTLWTKKYFLPVKSISFWLRSLNAASGTIYVDGLIDSVWTNIMAQPFDNSTVNKTVTADITAGECYQFKVYVEFNDLADRMALLFDDFKATFPYSISYLMKDEEVYDNKKFVSDYNNKVKHYYCVAATDKELDDPTGKNANVTAYSNEICVEGVDDDKNNKLIPLDITFVDGHFIVNLTELKSNYMIYVFTADGRLVEEIEPTNQQVVLPRYDSDMYVVKYSEKGKIKRKDQMGKIFY